MAKTSLGVTPNAVAVYQQMREQVLAAEHKLAAGEVLALGFVLHHADSHIALVAALQTVVARWLKQAEYLKSHGTVDSDVSANMLLAVVGWLEDLLSPASWMSPGVPGEAESSTALPACILEDTNGDTAESQELRRLKSFVEHRENESDRLNQQYAALEAENVQLRESNHDLVAENARLREQLPPARRLAVREQAGELERLREFFSAEGSTFARRVPGFRPDSATAGVRALLAEAERLEAKIETLEDMLAAKLVDQQIAFMPLTDARLLRAKAAVCDAYTAYLLADKGIPVGTLRESMDALSAAVTALRELEAKHGK